MAVGKVSPWIKGIVDTLVGASLIRQSSIPTENRLVVILVDTAFETACRAYLKYNAKIHLDQNHSHRDNMVKAVRAKLPLVDAAVWDSIDYYYQEIRCDFYHQSAGKTLTDSDLLDYQETVEFVMDHAFGIRVAELVKAEVTVVTPPDSPTPQALPTVASLTDVDDDRDKVLVAVAQVLPSSVEQVNSHLRQQGASLRLKTQDFTSIVARNSGTKKFYFFNKELRRWEPSALGRFRISQIAKGQTDE